MSPPAICSSLSRVCRYVHYGIPAEHEVQWRADGYPANLNRWPHPSRVDAFEQVTAQAHIGKGGAYIPSGMYVAKFDGTGTLSFEKDATIVSEDLVNKQYHVQIQSTECTGLENAVVEVGCGVRVRILRCVSSSFPQHMILRACLHRAACHTLFAFVQSHACLHVWI